MEGILQKFIELVGIPVAVSLMMLWWMANFLVPQLLRTFSFEMAKEREMHEKAINMITTTHEKVVTQMVTSCWEHRQLEKG